MTDTEKEGDVRVVRDDERNFGVQQLQLINVKEAGIRGGKFTGEQRLEWKTVAFYGERPQSLKLACEYALALGVRGNSTQELIKAVDRAEKLILDSIKRIFPKDK